MTTWLWVLAAWFVGAWLVAYALGRLIRRRDEQLEAEIAAAMVHLDEEYRLLCERETS